MQTRATPTPDTSNQVNVHQHKARYQTIPGFECSLYITACKLLHGETPGRLQNGKMLTLGNVREVNKCWVTCPDRVLHREDAIFCFADDENGGRETTRFTVSTLVLREVRYILPRVPSSAQANEHRSPPPSACITSKLDLVAKGNLRSCSPPHPHPRALNGCTRRFAAAKCSR